jgi:hypothetical protein
MNTNLTYHLLRHAHRERDLLRLSMAFKAHKPQWGSQASLITAGLSTTLLETDWDLPRLTERFAAWYERKTKHLDPAILLIRANQYRELIDLVQRTRLVELRPAEETLQGVQLLLWALSQRGLLLNDVHRIGQYPAQHPLTLTWLPEIQHNQEFSELFEKYRDQLEHVMLEQYFEIVLEEDRLLHPSMLFQMVRKHWSELGRLSNPFTPDPILRKRSETEGLTSTISGTRPERLLA